MTNIYLALSVNMNLFKKPCSKNRQQNEMSPHGSNEEFGSTIPEGYRLEYYSKEALRVQLLKCCD